MSGKRTYRVSLAVWEQRTVWIEAETEDHALDHAIGLYSIDPDNLQREDSGIIQSVACRDVLEG